MGDAAVPQHPWEREHPFSYVFGNMTSLGLLRRLIVTAFLMLYAEVSSENRTRTANNAADIITDLIRPNDNQTQKCCPLNYSYNLSQMYCQTEAENDDLSLYTISNISYGVPGCDEKSVLISDASQKSSRDHGGMFCQDKDVVLKCANASLYCSQRPCFRKCCQFGRIFQGIKIGCQFANRPFTPIFYDYPSLANNSLVSASDFGWFGNEACGELGKFRLDPDEFDTDKYYLGTDGKLHVPGYRDIAPKFGVFSMDDFCIENVETGNFSGISAFLCFSPSQDANFSFILLSLGFIISSICLLVTFLVYLFSPKPQNLFGTILMCYVGSLFTAYVCLAAVELGSEQLDISVCTFMGYAILFAFLASFSWLNIMSIDIWKKLRTIRQVTVTSFSTRRIRFFWYSVYGWGVPSIITAICAICDLTPGMLPQHIKPNIGVNSCWFSKHTNGIYIFFVTPISMIITCNVIMYLTTAWRCWKIKSEINRMNNNSRNKFLANKDQFIINGKLFIVMGVTWSLEIISFLAPHPFWYITDAANALHGLFIFTIFVLKKKVWEGVSHRIRDPLKRIRRLARAYPDDAPDVTSCRNSLETRKSYTLSTSGRTSSFMTDYINTKLL